MTADLDLDHALTEQARRHAWATAQDLTDAALVAVTEARRGLLAAGMGTEHPACERLDAVAEELGNLVDAARALAGPRTETVTVTGDRL